MASIRKAITFLDMTIRCGRAVAILRVGTLMSWRMALAVSFTGTNSVPQMAVRPLRLA